jgi:hypothetical protein
MRIALSLLLLSTSILSAQNFSFGAKGGGLLTEPAERFDQGRSYIVGPTFEVALPGSLAVEVNALYSRFGSSLSRTGVSFGRTRGNSWQFPVLGKYYFSDSRTGVKPFASAGMSFRQIWVDDDESRFGRRSSATSDLGIGAVAGGGIAIKFGRFTIAPEARYTRWGGNNFPATNPNEAQVLLGIGF